MSYTPTPTVKELHLQQLDDLYHELKFPKKGSLPVIEIYAKLLGKLSVMKENTIFCPGLREYIESIRAFIEAKKGESGINSIDFAVFLLSNMKRIIDTLKLYNGNLTATILQDEFSKRLGSSLKKNLEAELSSLKSKFLGPLMVLEVVPNLQGILYLLGYAYGAKIAVELNDFARMHLERIFAYDEMVKGKIVYECEALYVEMYKMCQNVFFTLRFMLADYNDSLKEIAASSPTFVGTSSQSSADVSDSQIVVDQYRIYMASFFYMLAIQAGMKGEEAANIGSKIFGCSVKNPEAISGVIAAKSIFFRNQTPVILASKIELSNLLRELLRRTQIAVNLESMVSVWREAKKIFQGIDCNEKIAMELRDVIKTCSSAFYETYYEDILKSYTSFLDQDHTFYNAKTEMSFLCERLIQLVDGYNDSLSDFNIVSKIQRVMSPSVV